MTGTPLATLAVISFEQEDIVAEAIQSCFDQTYETLEIILSDDGSSDGTWSVIEQMAASYKGPHRVLTNRNTPNLGIVGHVNKVLSMASGDVILLCAGDDIALPEKVARSVAVWNEDSKATKAVSSGYVDMSYDGKDLARVSAFSRKSRAAEPTAIEVIRNKAYCIGAAALWHRDVYDRFGPIPSCSFAEDNPLMLRAALLGSVRYLDEPLTRRRVGGVSNPTGAAVIDAYFEGIERTTNRRIATLKAMREDLVKFDEGDTKALIAACDKQLGPLEYERALSSLTQSERRAMIPSAIWRAVASGRPSYLFRTLAYAFPKAYVALRRRKYG